jgi:hypothetical protein
LKEGYFEEWVDRIFGHAFPVDVQKLIELDEYCGPDQATLLRLAEVFENARTLLAPYPDESLNQAFWNLPSQALNVIGDKAIDTAVRRRLIQSFEPLFRDFFAVRCQPVLGHCDEPGSPLNSACYMWWDFDCWSSAPDPLLLESMRSILAIDHVACQESALHGLGHWHRGHPVEVESIIDEFLNREHRLPEQLREYAASARSGCVL